MLLMLDGVQGVGKTTLLRELKARVPVKVLNRTPELNELLKQAPRDFALPEKHLPLIRAIFFQWKKTLDSIPDDESHNIWVLDRGPITTLAYQSMTLDYISRHPEHYAHYLSMCRRRNRTYSEEMRFYTDTTALDSLFGQAQTYIHKFMQHSFKYSALNRHKKVLALHIKASPDTISKRFTERREDIRANNMQDWFINKADEIDNYDRSYSIVRKWLEHETNFQTLEYCNDGFTSYGVAGLASIIRNHF